MSDENEHTNLKKNPSIRRGLAIKTENQIRTLLQNFNMNSDEHEAKLEGLNNQYENRLSSVKHLDQSTLNITTALTIMKMNYLNLRNITIPLLNF